MELPEGTRFQVLAPIVRGRKGEYEKLLGDLARKGFPRARIDGEVRDLAEPIRLPKTYKHTIEVVVDRLVAKPDIRRRVADSLETALELAEGIASIAVQTHDGGEEIQTFSPEARLHASTASRSTSSRPATSRSTRRTARARRATGSARGSRSTPSSSSPTRISRSTRERSRPGPAPRSSTGTACSRRWPRRTSSRLDTPWKKLPKAQRDVLLYGSDEEIYVRYKNRYGRQRSYHTTYEGVLPNVERRHAETDSDAQRDKLEQFMREIPCRTCKGARLRPRRLAVTVGGLNIAQLTDLSIRDTLRVHRHAWSCPSASR